VPPPPPPAEEAPEEASVPPPAPAEENPTEPDMGVAANPPAPGADAINPPSGTAAAAPGTVAATEPPSPRRHPFNIQIDAVMDDAGAREMAGRLRKLGYPATIVPSTIAGQTWYRVKVGPYATQAEARAAQERLRAQYNAAYAGH
jgi:cell division protein FtsN